MFFFEIVIQIFLRTSQALAKELSDIANILCTKCGVIMILFCFIILKEVLFNKMIPEAKFTSNKKILKIKEKIRKV